MMFVSSLFTITQRNNEATMKYNNYKMNFKKRENKKINIQKKIQ